MGTNSQLSEQNRLLSRELSHVKNNLEKFRDVLHRERREKEILSEKISGLTREMAEFSKSINEEAKRIIREQFPKMQEVIQIGLKNIRNLTQNKGGGMGI